jgi:hypothetical protein
MKEHAWFPTAEYRRRDREPLLEAERIAVIPMISIIALGPSNVPLAVRGALEIRS